MPTPLWADFFKTFSFAFTPDPIERTVNTKDVVGAGITSPDSIPSMSPDGSFWGGADSRFVRLRETNDFIDLSTVSNRQSRYKEYERLRSVPEIEMALNVFADEACLSGDTPVATPFGLIPIEELAKTHATEKFLVYCWDFQNNDYTLGWAHSPRQTKIAKTQILILDDGSRIETTPDHRILLKNGEWKQAGEIEEDEELMPFHRVPANQRLTKHPVKQYPRVFTFSKGWMHERQFVDEWRTNKVFPKLDLVNQYCRYLAQDLSMSQILKLIDCDWRTLKNRMKTEGFSIREVRWLAYNFTTTRIVIGKIEGKEQPVYDLTVEKHENFCTSSTVVHNCQKDSKGNALTISCKNDDVRDELEFLFFHRSMVNVNRRVWADFKSLLLYGDLFYEIVVNLDNPKDGVLKLVRLPADSMYRIETTKGKVVEFQQSKEGPDYQSLTRAPIVQATDQEIMMATAIRFAPEQIIHAKIGDDRKTFYPYGVSMVEAARGPAHQLRLMEDAMLVYRLCLDGSTRIRTNNGYKYISEIKTGDKVFSYSHGAIFENIVTATMRHQPKEIWEAKSKHFSIKGTPDHRILVLRNGIEQYVEIKDLKTKSDKFISALHESNVPQKIETVFGQPWAKLSMQQRVLFRQTNYTNISEKLRKFKNPERVKQFLYTEGKSLPLDLAQEIIVEFNLTSEKLVILNKGEINSERLNLPEYVTPEFARLFGFIYGDGNVHKNGINFTSGTDSATNEFYKNLLVKFFGKTRFSPDKRSKIGVGKYEVSSTTVAKIFKSLGYIGTHKNIRIPSWVFNASTEIRKEFVLGLCDADGTIRHTNKGTWFCTLELCNKNLIEDVKELWQSIGLSSGKLSSRTRKCERVIVDHKVGENTGYQITLTQLPLEKYENVISIAKVGEDFVYDISVDGNVQNFIANGIPVHNSRAPERRVFYIDVGQLPPFKAEAFMEKMKDQFRKKKISSNRPGMQGPNSVEERYHAPAVDEDYWIPTRPNSNTKIETLPGAQNLGEIDDAVYFRNRLFTAMQFPKNYFNVEDASVTKITLSAQDIRVARLIERLQAPYEDAMWEVADRHLKLLGYPEELYSDLAVKMTPPSEWRELSRAEITSARIQNAGALKSGNLMSDYDILNKWMGYSENETKLYIARLKMQKIEDAKLQVIAQNPALLGVGIPSAEDEEKDKPEIGATPEGPNPELAPPEAGPSPEGMPPEAASPTTSTTQGVPLPEPTQEDISKYDMYIQSYSSDQDVEPLDQYEYE
jgi:hypothetical protein